MPTLVTGATGLIGHAIATRLAARGDAVRCLVRDEARARAILPAGVDLCVGDLSRPESLRPAVDGVDLLFHAAGMPEQWQAEADTFDRVNHQGTVHLLEAARQAGVSRVVYTSTMDIFEAVQGGTLVETRLATTPRPTAYERSKQAADRAAQRFVDQGMDLVHLCPAAVYGPGPSHVALNSFFIKLLKKATPVLPPGGMSVVYIDGCADAHLAAAERGQTGQRYLLADAYASNLELAQATVNASELRRPPAVGPLWMLRATATLTELLARLTGIPPLVAHSQLTFLQWQARVDASKAQVELGFEPMPVDQGVARTVAFLQAEGLAG